MKKILLTLAISTILTNTNAQNVGIGTASPTNKLDVNGSIRLRETSYALGSGANPSQVIAADVSQAQLTGAPTGAISLTVTGSQAGQLLTIYNNTGIDASLNSQTIKAGKAVIFIHSNANWRATADVVTNDWTKTSTGATPAIKTDNQYVTGNVGIGDFSSFNPTANLHVIGVVSSNPVITLESSNFVVNGNNSISFKHSAAALATIQSILPGSNDVDLVFKTTNDANTNTADNNREIMRITGDGNVGIGNTTPGKLLEIGNNLALAPNVGSLRISGSNGSIGNWRQWDFEVGAISTSTSAYNTHRIRISNNGTEVATIDENGRMGIGTTSPQAPLHVAGTTTSATSTGCGTSNRFMKHDQGNNVNVGGSWGSVVAYFQGDVISTAAIISSCTTTFSDERIKNILNISNGKNDLEILKKIRITDYLYKDTISNNNRMMKKVIAQQVESVYPNAVSKTVNTIPDIYVTAANTLFDSSMNTMQITLNKAHQLKVGDKIKIVVEGNSEIIPQVTKINTLNSFTISLQKNYNQVFVYGKEVNDFRSVDYDAISMLNVSATQELARKIAELEYQNSSLKAENNQLNTTLSTKANALDINKLKAQLDDLKTLIEKNGIRADK